jgi:hypothetical protein
MAVSVVVHCHCHHLVLPMTLPLRLIWRQHGLWRHWSALFL